MGWAEGGRAAPNLGRVGVIEEPLVDLVLVIEALEPVILVLSFDAGVRSSDLPKKEHHNRARGRLARGRGGFKVVSG